VMFGEAHACKQDYECLHEPSAGPNSPIGCNFG
jgi:hypothetical protein